MLARYGVADLPAIRKAWDPKLAADPSLRRSYVQACASYRRWLADAERGSESGVARQLPSLGSAAIRPHPRPRRAGFFRAYIVLNLLAMRYAKYDGLRRLGLCRGVHRRRLSG